MKKGQNTVAIA